ncbi:AraC family transcriptional regulator [Sphingobium sufflavum]|uniref:helix-turn-helix domain-containing protein n=1 Tax=Sphingobium sufflavum TaxID=1129547 RepID=UPI001F3B9F06|nr:AraC family transcriptional regulator [Sphingobium sufflavum]MCE7795164.1 AraC family transcriptional regulator [Sphingobium sufflavum]
MVDRPSEAGGSSDPALPDPFGEPSGTEGPPPTNRVSLSYLAPPEDLSALFGPMYLFVADKRAVSDHTRADFAQIRFMLMGTGDYSFHDGRRESTPACCMLGPTSAATRFEVDGPMRVIGVSVLPLGWVALGAGDAGEVADSVFDLAERFGRAWSDLHARLCGIDDADDAAALLWPFLRSCIRPPSPAEEAFVLAIDEWLADERSPRVDSLQEVTGLSSRQIARLSNRFYGAPPKYLARKYRALRCALILARDNIDWADLCDGAFYDQSHFIREFKHFIGLTPSQLRDNASLVIRLTMGRRDVAGTIANLSRIS